MYSTNSKNSNSIEITQSQISFNSNSMAILDQTEDLQNHQLTHNKQHITSTLSSKDTTMLNAFRDAIEQVANDELIKVFSESPDTKEFIFNRIKEIIDDVMHFSNNQVIKNLESEIGGLKKEISRLQTEIQKVINTNSELQNKLNKESMEHSHSLKKQLKDLTRKIKSIQQEKKDIEVENCELGARIDDLVDEMEKLKEERVKQIKEAVKAEKEQNEEMQNRIVELEKYKYKAELEKGDFDKMIKQKEEALKKKEREIEMAMEGQRELNLTAEAKSDEAKKQKRACQDLEKKLKKMEYERGETDSNYQRKIKNYGDEIELLNKKVQDLEANIAKKSKDKEYKQHIKLLEKKFKEIKETSQTTAHKLEETEFENGQVKESLNNLKKELLASTESLSIARKEKHQMELSLIESKDKVSELLMQNSGLIEDLGKNQQEMEYLKKQFGQSETFLKTERRKSATLERELDQCKFSIQTLEKSSTEIIETMKEKIKHLKNEVLALENRLERQLKESQRKMDEQRKVSMEALNQLRELETSEENHKVVIENLKKKVEFFKAKSLEACSTPTRSIYGQQSHNQKPENHYSTDKKSQLFSGIECGQDDSMESNEHGSSHAKDGRDQNGSEARMRKSSSAKTLLKGETNEETNQQLKAKIAHLALKTTHLRESFMKDKVQLQQEINFFKKSLKNALQMLALKVKDENRRAKFVNRELVRAKKDLIMYEKMMGSDELSMVPTSTNRPRTHQEVSETNRSKANFRDPVSSNFSKKRRIPFTSNRQQTREAERSFSPSNINPHHLGNQQMGAVNYNLNLGPQQAFNPPHSAPSHLNSGLHQHQHPQHDSSNQQQKHQKFKKGHKKSRRKQSGQARHQKQRQQGPFKTVSSSSLDQDEDYYKKQKKMHQNMVQQEYITFQQENSSLGSRRQHQQAPGMTQHPHSHHLNHSNPSGKDSTLAYSITSPNSKMMSYKQNGLIQHFNKPQNDENNYPSLRSKNGQNYYPMDSYDLRHHNEYAANAFSNQSKDLKPVSSDFGFGIPEIEERSNVMKHGNPMNKMNEIERDSADLCQRLAELRHKEMVLREQKFGASRDQEESLKEFRAAAYHSSNQIDDPRYADDSLQDGDDDLDLSYSKHNRAVFKPMTQFGKNNWSSGAKRRVKVPDYESRRNSNWTDDEELIDFYKEKSMYLQQEMKRVGPGGDLDYQTQGSSAMKIMGYASFEGKENDDHRALYMR